MCYFSIFTILTPKSNVVWLYEDFTLRQAYEKILKWNYSAMPIIDDTGTYKGVLSEGDLLRRLEFLNITDVKEMEKHKLKDIKSVKNISAVKHDVSYDTIVHMLENQNFVPVVDDRDKFIGIATRKSLITYLYKECTRLENLSKNSNVLSIRSALMKRA